MQSFREAVEARDTEAMAALLADDVVFTSPVAFKPYPGKPITAAILRGVMRVFEDFRYVREIVDGDTAMLEFETEMDGIHVNDVDIIRFDADGHILDFKVMVRPLKAVNKVWEAMAAQLERARKA